MKYIKYWNVFAENFHDGYIVKEDETFYHLCYPLKYLWVTHLNGSISFNEVRLEKIEKHNFNFIEPQRYISQHESWIFDFPVTYGNELDDAAHFFDFFFYYKELEFHEQLEKTLSYVHKSISPITLNRIIGFVLSHYKTDKNKLRATLMPHVSKYLYTEQKYPCVIFTDDYSKDSFTCFVVKTDEKFSYLCDAFLFHWLKKINRLSFLEKVPLTKVPLGTSLREIKDEKLYHEWVYDFPIDKKSTEEINDIMLFFQTFISHNSLSLHKRLEICIKQKETPLLKELVPFVIKTHHEDNGRLKAIFSETIAPYL